MSSETSENLLNNNFNIMVTYGDGVLVKTDKQLTDITTADISLFSLADIIVSDTSATELTLQPQKGTNLADLKLISLASVESYATDNKSGSLVIPAQNANHSYATHAISLETALELKLIRNIDTNTSLDAKQKTYIDQKDREHQFISYRSLVVQSISFNEQLTHNQNQQTYKVLEQISRAVQLVKWHQDHQFCSRCGSATTIHPNNEHAAVCPNCHYHQYPRLQPCVITAIYRRNPKTGKPQILLANHHRYADLKNTNRRYGLIAGFVEVGETLESAVAREIFEEVGLHVKNIRYQKSQPWPYPSNLMVGFFADYESGDINIQHNELTHAAFFDLDNLPNIPPKGTIAYRLIEQLCHEHGFDSPKNFTPF